MSIGFQGVKQHQGPRALRFVSAPCCVDWRLRSRVEAGWEPRKPYLHYSSFTSSGGECVFVSLATFISVNLCRSPAHTLLLWNPKPRASKIETQNCVWRVASPCTVSDNRGPGFLFCKGSDKLVDKDLRNNSCSPLSEQRKPGELFLLKIFYLFFILREKRGRKRGPETSISCLLHASGLGTEPTTQACALTGN